MSTQNQMLADVAAAAMTAAAQSPATPQPAAPAQLAAAAPAATQEPAASPAPAPSSQAAEASPSPFTPRVALEMTALAYPSMAANLTKLAIAADGGENAFRAALLAERAGGDGAAPAAVSTAQTATAVEEPGKPRANGRGAGLKAAAKAQNGN